MNIRFTKLGEEQCETCLSFEMSKHSHDHNWNVSAEKHSKDTENAVTIDTDGNEEEHVSDVEVTENEQRNISFPDCEQLTQHLRNVLITGKRSSQERSVRSVDLQ